MVPRSQAATTQNVEALAEEGSFGEAGVPYQAEEGVGRALARRNLDTTSFADDRRAASAGNLNPHVSSQADTVLPLSFPPSRVVARSTNTFHPLQEWEGYVVEIGDDEFVARLVDLSAGKSLESEEAIIPLEMLSEQYASDLAVGKIFRWVIGYERSPAGTKKSVSEIVFRDLPRMTARDVKSGQNWTRSILSAFDQ